MTKEQAHGFIEKMFVEDTTAIMIMIGRDHNFRSVTAEDGEDGKLTFCCSAEAGKMKWKDFLSKHDWNQKSITVPNLPPAQLSIWMGCMIPFAE